MMYQDYQLDPLSPEEEESLSPSSGSRAAQVVRDRLQRLQEVNSQADDPGTEPKPEGPSGRPVATAPTEEDVRKKVMSLLAGAGSGPI